MKHKIKLENGLLKWIWKTFVTKEHSHLRENNRRKLQIERGTLTESNGLVIRKEIG